MDNLTDKIYKCIKCNYYTPYEKDYSRHCLTKKHRYQYETSLCTCYCGKIYSHKSGLYRHKQQCNYSEEPVQTEETVCMPSNQDKLFLTNEMVLTLIKQNQEFKELMYESHKKCEQLYEQNLELTNKVADIAKEGKFITNNNTCNQQFNLNIFLNEKCKDALNICEFINSINVSFQDLENTGKLGYVDGISKIILTKLKELDICKRPIHCSDLRREVLYIKNDNKWEKESEHKPLMQQTIRAVAIKNIKQLTEWIKMYPDCTEYDSRKNKVYHQILTNSMSGDTQEIQDENLHRIIRNIAKGVVIDKTIR